MQDNMLTLTRNTQIEEQFSARVFNKLPRLVLTGHAKLEVLPSSCACIHLTIGALP